MDRLYIFPTARAIRQAHASFVLREGFIPTMLRMDEFIDRLVLVEPYVPVDLIGRVLYLREASRFSGFESFRFDSKLVRFFSHAKALLGFFEELSFEEVEFDALRMGDTYAEFDTHIDLLEILFNRYGEKLHQDGLTDRAFVPKQFRFNHFFLEKFPTIEVFLEGYLSRFELRILLEATRHTQVIVHYALTPFSRKMQQRFESLGVQFEGEGEYRIDLNTKTIISKKKLKDFPQAKVYQCMYRLEQVVGVFDEIMRMVHEGIKPEHIVVVVPDESFAHLLRRYDRMGNLNFAMGLPYQERRGYRKVQALLDWFQGGVSDQELSALGLLECAYALQNFLGSAKGFLQILQDHGVFDATMEDETSIQFACTFRSHTLAARDWIFFWLQYLSQIRIDDVRGGKVTVLGVLETRAVSYEGVIVVDFNEGFVPDLPAKDMFLNSAVRAHAALPTRADREALQKNYYYRLFLGAKQITLMYVENDENAPSRFLYEMGLGEGKVYHAYKKSLYPISYPLCAQSDPSFMIDAHSVVWSASRLKTFLDCKRKYFYRYIASIKPHKEEFPNEGVIVHAALKEVFEHYQNIQDVKEFWRIFDKALHRLLDGYGAHGHYMFASIGRKMQSFAQEQVRHFLSGYRVIACEEHFICEIEGLRFQGSIDRIDTDGNEVLLIDYKTGSIQHMQSSNVARSNDFQMSIYQIAMKDRYKDAKACLIQVYEQAKLIEVAHMQERTKLLLEYIGQLKQTRQVQAVRCEDLHLCEHCPYRLLCERGEYL